MSVPNVSAIVDAAIERMKLAKIEVDHAKRTVYFPTEDMRAAVEEAVAAAIADAETRAERFRDTVLSALGLDGGDPTTNDVHDVIERLSNSEAEKRAELESVAAQRDEARADERDLAADLVEALHRAGVPDNWQPAQSPVEGVGILAERMEELTELLRECPERECDEADNCRDGENGIARENWCEPCDWSARRDAALAVARPERVS